MILSVAKYYSPGGKAIQDTGVTPSVPLTEAEAGPEVDDDTAAAAPEPQPKSTEDLLMKKAIEVVVNGKPSVASRTGSSLQASKGK